MLNSILDALSKIVSFVLRGRYVKANYQDIFVQFDSLSQKEVVWQYWQILQQLTKILDVIFKDYEHHNGITVSINDKFEQAYRKLHSYILAFQEYNRVTSGEFQSQHQFSYRFPYSLQTDHESMAKLWHGAMREIIQQEIDSMQKSYNLKEYDSKLLPAVKDLFEVTNKYSDQALERIRIIMGQDENQVILQIKYDGSLITIEFENKEYRVVSPQAGSNRDKLFRYFWENKGKSKTLVQIRKGSKIEPNIDISNTLVKMGFRGELRNLFFPETQFGMTFKKAYTREELRKSKVLSIKLIEDLEKLEPILE